MLAVLTRRPDPRLRPFVRSYAFRASTPASPLSVEPVIARLGAVLEFHFAAPFSVHLEDGNLVMAALPVTVIGPLTQRRARIVICKPVQVLTIFFEPFGLHALFGIPNAELADIGVDAHSALGQHVASLNERLGNTPDFDARIALLDEFFLSQTARRKTSPSILPALRLLTRHNVSINVRDVARQAGVSTRTLERAALQYGGMSPKLVTRVARLEHVLRHKIQAKSSWIEAAHACGYHDQMHMIRDFHLLAGDTPTQLLNTIKPEHLSLLGLRWRPQPKAR